ncbi:MAG: hypothetical protein M1824_004644 [Vezdaea acicularis]|nr:MAG: hypothetical protein M1824_004644 [Vezdaea acicularis]
MKSFLFLTLATAVLSQSLLDAINAIPDLSTLAGFIERDPTINETYSTASNVTLFAPSNEAFAAAVASPVGYLLNDPDIVHQALAYVLVNGTWPSTAFSTVPSFYSSFLTNSSWTNVTGGAPVEVVVEGNDTVFRGSGAFPGSKIVSADHAFPGGVVHVIDSLTNTPANISYTAAAINNTALLTVVNAGQIGPFESPHDVTFLGLSNDAFSEVIDRYYVKKTLSYDDLQKILLSSRVEGQVIFSTGWTTEGVSVETALGTNVTLKIVNGTNYVDDAPVVQKDLLVANGVLHLLGSVNYPPGVASQ